MGKKKQAPTRHSSRGKRGKSFDKAPRPVVILAVEGATEREYLKALNQVALSGSFRLRFLSQSRQVVAEESHRQYQAEG